MKGRKRIEIIIVGSGAGGASLAYELSKKGKNVLIIEAGPVIKSVHLGNFWQVLSYYHNSISRELTTIYHSYNVGGTTVFSCGSIVRSLQDKFLAYNIDLENAFQNAERDLSVNKNKITTDTKTIISAAQRLGYNMVPMSKMFNPGRICDLCCNCVLGCHRRAKWDARSYIDQAIENGAILIPSTKVEKVLFSSGAQVRGVETSDKEVIKSKTVILSAGGLNTPIILQKSNISAGQGLFIDFFNITYGIIDNLSRQKSIPMEAICTDFYNNQGFILSPCIDHWSQIMLFCPFWWNIIRQSPQKRIVGIMTKIADERVGQVGINGSINKVPTEQDRFRLKTGSSVAKKILQEIGAKNIITTKHNRGAHPGGTSAIGEVVNNRLEVLGTRGLYVCDASVFPTAPGLPPILTIVALSKWLSQKLI